jgi:uncharacterized protein YukE
MGSDQTKIDPEGARSANARLLDTAAKFGSAVARMQAAENSSYGCWGDDQFGQAFAKSYLPGAESMLKNSGQVYNCIGETTDAIEQGIESFEKTDQQNASSM